MKKNTPRAPREDLAESEPWACLEGRKQPTTTFELPAPWCTSRRGETPVRCHWRCGIVMVTTVQYLTKNCVSQFEAEAGQKRYDGIVGSTLRSGELLPGGARPLGYRGACYAFLVWSLHTRLVLGSPAPRNDDEHLALMKGGWDCFLLPVMLSRILEGARRGRGGT